MSEEAFMRTILIAVALMFALTGLSIAAEEQQSIYGIYVSKGDSKEYLSLLSDGSFSLKQRKKPPDMNDPFEELRGRYQLSGETLTLELEDGGEATGKLKDNKFEDGDGQVWVKQGTEKPKPVERPKGPPIKLY